LVALIWGTKLSKAWSHQLEVSLDGQINVNIAPWFTRATVDAIGEGASLGSLFSSNDKTD
jgi:hypothetical protein